MSTLQRARYAALSTLLFSAACLDGPDPGGGPDAGAVVDDEAAGERRARVLFPWGEREVAYEIVGEDAIIEGDIVIGAAEDFAARATIVTDLSRRWPNAVVRYAVAADVTATMQTRLDQAIAQYHVETPLQFVEIADPCPGGNPCETDYLLVRRNPSGDTFSTSALGMQGGRQFVNLGASNGVGTYIHELGHAVGLYHEQTRADRNQHVAVRLECVIQTSLWQNAFALNGPDEGFGSYDFQSVMHYASTTGRRSDWTQRPCNGGFPLLRIPGAAACPNCTDADGDGFAERIAATSALSTGDVNALWAMYGSEQGVEEASDALGYSVAIADFDNDGFVDVAAGAPREYVLGNTVAWGGAVMTYKGGPEGFQPWRVYLQETLGGVSSGFDRFGESMAVGDFNDDGFPDLAVSSPNDEVSGHDNSGAVYILRGGPGGLGAGQIIVQSTIGAAVEANDHFGSALAVGDFNGDGVDDLAVGARGEAPPGGVRAGWVYVLRGKAGSAIAMTLFDSFGQHEPIGHGPAWTIGDPMGSPAHGDHFGAALAAADMDGDGRDDLVVGAPFDSDNLASAGAAYVLRGGATQMIAWQRIRDLFADVNQRSASSLAAGDFDADGLGEIAMGMPEDNVDGVTAAGSVLLFHATATTIVTGQRIDNSDMPGDVAAYDRVGHALWFEPFRRQLFVGVPWEDNGSVANAGVAHRFGFQSSTPVHEVQLRQSPNGVEEPHDYFGWSVATVRNGTSTWIAVGSHGENNGAGAVFVYRSSLDGPPQHVQNLLQTTDGSESD